MTYENIKDAIRSLENECENMSFQLDCERKCKTDGKDCFIKLSIEALDKQIPKKPEDYHHCPRCGSGLPAPGITHKMCASCYNPKHCPDCGQRITWSEEE